MAGRHGRAEKDMTEPDWKQIARQLNEHMASARLSSQDLANRAGVDRKTVDRIRAGQAVRTRTLQWVEQALGIELGAPRAIAEGIAPARFGGYRYESVASYVGAYIACRRSFDAPGRIIAGWLEIRWDDDVGALRFSEHQDNRGASGKAYTYQFGGDVLIPPNLGVMHLVVRSDDGRVRTISTSMPREDDGTLYMRGFILTLNEIRDIGYYPVTSPIFLAKTGERVTREPGVIDETDPDFLWANNILDDIEQKFLPAGRLAI